MKVNRRNFLIGTAAAAAQAGVAAALPNSAQPGASPKADVAAGGRKPNIVIYHSDQFRWDFVGANGLNSSTRTPNLDALATAGTNFNHAVTNQPVCGPSRSVMLTGRYASETGVWHNGLGLKQELPTIATELRKAGGISPQGRRPRAVDAVPSFRSTAEAFSIFGKLPTRSNSPLIPMREPSGIATTTRSPTRTSIASIS